MKAELINSYVYEGGSTVNVINSLAKSTTHKFYNLNLCVYQELHSKSQSPPILFWILFLPFRGRSALNVSGVAISW